MKQISGINLAEYSGDILGDAYEYMISNFASESGKKAGEFYTPQEVIKLMAMIVMDGKEDVKGYTVYDPTMGTAGFLIAAMRNTLRKTDDDDFEKDNIIKIKM